MSNYWVNFITSGNPNGNGLVEWPAYDQRTEPFLEFGTSITAGTHLLQRELDFLDAALSRQR